MIMTLRGKTPGVSSEAFVAETAALIGDVTVGPDSSVWFGAAFGPAIMLSLFWRRFNFPGAVASILAGAIVDILWLAFLGSLGIYEILPGCIIGLIVGVVVTLATPAPEKAVTDLFDKAAAGKDA